MYFKCPQTFFQQQLLLFMWLYSVDRSRPAGDHKPRKDGNTIEIYGAPICTGNAKKSTYYCTRCVAINGLQSSMSLGAAFRLTRLIDSCLVKILTIARVIIP